MAPKLDKVNVIDLEATCWDQPSPPPGQVQEIIEIGICVLHPMTGDIEDKRSIIVRPIQSDVSPFCTSLTTLTQEQVDDGVALLTAFKILEDEYDSRNRLWASWGDWDRSMFHEEATRKGLLYPFGRSHLNAKLLFGLYYGYKNAPGMMRAYKQVDFEPEGTHHRGDDDAYNTAKLLHTCIGKELV